MGHEHLPACRIEGDVEGSAQHAEGRKVWIVKLPRYATSKNDRVIKDELTGELCGPIFNKHEITKLTMKQIALRYPSIGEQVRRLLLLQHFLELYGVSMDAWTPTTAFLVANYKILEKYAEEQEQQANEHESVPNHKGTHHFV